MPKYKYTQAELERLSRNEWLTDRERQVFELYYRRGWRIEDIAAELDFNRCTVDRALDGIRKKFLIQNTDELLLK